MSNETLVPLATAHADEQTSGETGVVQDNQADCAKLVLEVHVTADYVVCPHCSEHIEGWTRDPRGFSDTCDSCKKPFRVSQDASIKFR